MNEKVYSIKEAAELLKMTRSGVHWLKDTGKIEAEKIGEQYVVSLEELNRYLKKKGESPIPQIQTG